MLSRYYIPLGMYRSVENEAPTESSHSVGMQPCDLTNGSICVIRNAELGIRSNIFNSEFRIHNYKKCELHFLPSDANLRLAKLIYYI
ncbi:MAG: hypothetical protein LBQ66_06205 [Planctomycetaceae bacterium]|jgi:hypothetical protein|nr:hypothetical protein [Planctomycetaceae bacterium]